jgi:L-asparaginase II
MTRFDDAFEPIAVATRSGFDESLHHGAGAAVSADGTTVAAVGDPTLVVYPRSCLKPMQADAMVALGLDLPGELLAVACASHDGAPMHLAAVAKILSTFDLSEADLQNTPAQPLCDPCSAGPPSSLRQNCSGKHAAMLATCVVRGWPTTSYLDPEHPLQVAITSHLADLGCTVGHVGVDGCGAPTHALALDDLARVYGTLASSGAAVARAMRAHPEMVGGVDRDVSLWMSAAPGLIAKEGAAGVMAVGLSDGSGVAFKIGDGSELARRAVTPEALRRVGVDVDGALSDTRDRVAVPMLGHGEPVGRIDALRWSSCSS